MKYLIIKLLILLCGCSVNLCDAKTKAIQGTYECIRTGFGDRIDILDEGVATTYFYLQDKTILETGKYLLAGKILTIKNEYLISEDIHGKTFSMELGTIRTFHIQQNGDLAGAINASRGSVKEIDGVIRWKKIH